MTTILEALEEEIAGIEESIEKRKRGKLFQNPTMAGEIISLTNLQLNTTTVLSKLMGGTDLIMKCSCGFESATCNFEFNVYVQNCEHCGNHIMVEVNCPECKKIRTVYRDRRYED
jgi:hypothetical protein